MAVQFLAAIAGEIVTAQKILVLVRAERVHVFRDDIAARTAHRLALGRLQRRHHSAAVFERGVIHQIVAQHAVLIPHSCRKSPRTRVEQNASGFERARCEHHHFRSNFTGRASGAVDKSHAIRLAFGIHHQMADHRVAHQLKAASARRGRKRN